MLLHVKVKLNNEETEMKQIIQALLIAFAFSAFNPSVIYSTGAESFKYITNQGYTYEHVLIGNVWWIFVYDEDHRLVDCYPEIND